MKEEILLKVKSEDSLSKYILVFDNIISNKKTNEIIKDINSYKWEKQVKYIFPNQAYDIRYSDVLLEKPKSSYDFEILQFDFSDLRHKNKTTLFFEEIIGECLSNYVFNFYDFDWWKKWYNFTQARFQRYKTNMFLPQHCDHWRTMFDGNWKGVPIYSVIGFLNDDYEGGELIFWDDTVIEKQAGRVVVFPSNFLYPHQVTKVTDGIKYTFSSYAF